MKELLEALRSGTAARVRELLLADSRAISSGAAWKADGKHPDGGGKLLWEAVSSRVERADKLRALINAGADVDVASLPKGATLLTHALVAGDLELAKLALSLRADPNKRDRRGLLPLAIATLKDDSFASSLLVAAGAELEGEVGAVEAERAFLLEKPIMAEIHETLKWAIRGAGFQIRHMRVPAEDRILYWIEGWRIRLELLPGPSLALTLENGESGEPVADLLPQGESVTNTLLRGHLITFLKGVRSPGGFRANPVGELASVEIGEGPWALLGVSAKASPEEINRAYRKLAKLYHPDRAGTEGHGKMQELNRAYQEVAKKKKS